RPAAIWDDDMQQWVIDRGVLAQARWCASPNCNARPQSVTVDTLVVHGITLPPGHFGGGHVDALFCNRLQADADPWFAEVASARSRRAGMPARLVRTSIASWLDWGRR